MDIADFGRMLLRRKTMMLALIAASVLIAMIVSLLLPNYYRSEAMVLAFAPESGGLSAALSASPLAGALTGTLGGVASPADKVLVFLKSRTVAEMVIKRFDLLRVFNLNKWDAEKGAWKNPAKPPIMEDAVKTLGKKVTTFKKSKEGTITIAVEWKDPKLAAQIANYYVVALAEFMKDKSVNTTVQIVDPAVPAERKSSPRVAVNMIMAGFGSMLLGVFIALMLEHRPGQRKA
ncbi:MAG: YveK family protein [Nitrospirota bacterium]